LSRRKAKEELKQRRLLKTLSYNPPFLLLHGDAKYFTFGGFFLKKSYFILNAMIIHNLSLLAPIYYAPEKESNPFNFETENGEKLYCFKIDENESMSFEPDTEKLLGHLIFQGSGEIIAGPQEAGEQPAAELPAGKYLFAQEREILSREGIIAMAVEIQEEALWQGLEPGNRIYLRYLFEDGKWVTQLYRPVTESKGLS
jgi:hypothetical protein